MSNNSSSIEHETDSIRAAKSKPTIANATPTILCRDGALRNNKMPATETIAAQRVHEMDYP